MFKEQSIIALGEKSSKTLFEQVTRSLLHTSSYLVVPSLIIFLLSDYVEAEWLLLPIS